MKLNKLPRPLHRSNYRSAIAEFVQRCRREPGIRAVYIVGTISQPGISDLDLLLSLDDKLRSPLKIDTSMPRAAKALIGHGSVLKVPTSLMSSVQTIDDFPLHHIWGDNYRFKKFLSPAFEVCRIMDWLPERIARLQKIKTAPTVDATWTLQFLKSITVSLEKFSILTNTPLYARFISDIRSLRKNWWKLRRRRDHLVTALTEAEVVSLRALRDCDEYVQRYHYIQPVNTPSRVQFSIKGGPRFVFGKSIAIEKNRLVLSPSYFSFYAAQVALSNGWLKNKLQASFSPKSRISRPVLSASLHQAITQRMRFTQECGAFLQRAGIHRGLLKYGWFLV